MILLVDEEYGSDSGEGEAGEHGDAPPGLQLEQHGGVVQGEVEAAGKQGRDQLFPVSLSSGKWSERKRGRIQLWEYSESGIENTACDGGEA